MDQTTHTLGNILIKLEGRSAKVETYFIAYHRLRNEGNIPQDWILGGL